MALVFNRSTFKFKDRQGAQASHKVLIPALTAANFTATLGDVGAYALALEGVASGNFYGYDISYPVGHTETVPPLGCKRGDKIQVVGQETVENKRTFVSTIPTANLDRSIWDTDDHYLAAAAEWIAYISAYSGLVISPAGNDLTFVDALLVTRSK